MASLPNRRLPIALLCVMASIALVAITRPGLAPAATATNPASSTLGPVSKQAQPGSDTRTSSGAAAGAGTSTATTPAGGVGAQAGGTAAGTGLPTTTYAPPATRSATPAGGAGAATTSPGSLPGAHRKTSSSTSAGAIALAALAALVALAALAWGLARWQAYEPRWTVSLRHAMAEAGFRASSTWAEFSDWARLGR